MAAQDLIHALGELAAREVLSFAADLRRRGKLADVWRWQAIAEAAEQILQAKVQRRTGDRRREAATEVRRAAPHAPSPAGHVRSP